MPHKTIYPLEWEPQSQEALEEWREYIHDELYAGRCQICREPINNAEYDICQQCAHNENEYWKDVHSETGCSQYGYDGQ